MKYQKLLEKYENLKDHQKRLKKIIKDTHVEIEWLDRKKNDFEKTLIWKLGYILKNQKGSKNEK